MKMKHVLALLFVCVVLCACGKANTQENKSTEVSPTESLVVALSPTGVKLSPTATNSPTPVEAPLPGVTDTPTPMVTSTPEPTATSTPTSKRSRILLRKTALQ